MIGEPVARLREELFNFILPDEVVLPQIKDGYQHVQVLQQPGNSDCLLQLDREEWTVSPLGKLFVERVSLGRNYVAQRLEDSVKQVLAAAHWQYIDVDRKRNGHVHSISLFLRPAGEGRAKHLRIATLINDDATYGRSFTY